jgi:hypothetical protein
MQNQATGANRLPDDIIDEIASSIPSSDKTTLQNGSLVRKGWRVSFQQQLFKNFRVHKPSLADSELLKLATQADHERLLCYIRVLSFGVPYDLTNPTCFEFGKIHDNHLDIVLNCWNLTSLHFSSSTFAWFELSDTQIDCFFRILSMPRLQEVSFFAYPGCYMPLSFFLFTPNIKILKLEDVSFTPVNEIQMTKAGSWDYINLKDTLQSLATGWPALRCHQLTLKGLGLIANFLDFISNVTMSLAWPDGPQLIRLDLDCTDTYLPVMPNQLKPVASEVAGKLLMRLGQSIQHLRLQVENNLSKLSFLLLQQSTGP